MSIRKMAAGLVVAAPVAAFFTAISPSSAWADPTCPNGWTTIMNGQTTTMDGQCANPADGSSSACEAGLKLNSSAQCIPLGDNSSGKIPGDSSGGQAPLNYEMMPRPELEFLTNIDMPCLG